MRLLVIIILFLSLAPSFLLAQENREELSPSPTNKDIQAQATNNISTNNLATNVISTNNLTNIFNPFSTIFVLSLNAGLNFYILDEEEVEKQYQLERISDTISFTYHVKLGVVLQYHYMVMLAYQYSKRENFHYPENYFNVNQKSVEVRDHYSLQLQSDYFLYNYLDDYNISFGMGMGWLRKIIEFDTIGDYNSSLQLLSSTQELEKDYFVASIQSRLYYRLRDTGTLYAELGYQVVIPDGENYPHLVLGIDVNFDLTPEPPKNTNPFFNGTPGPTPEEERKPRQATPKKGIRKEIQEGATDIYEGASTIKEDITE